MPNEEENFNFILKLECILGRGLDESAGAVGLLSSDNEKMTSLRDSAVYVLALLRCEKAKYARRGGKDHEKTKTSKASK